MRWTISTAPSPYRPPSPTCEASRASPVVCSRIPVVGAMLVIVHHDLAPHPYGSTEITEMRGRLRRSGMRRVGIGRRQASPLPRGLLMSSRNYPGAITQWATHASHRTNEGPRSHAANVRRSMDANTCSDRERDMNDLQRPRATTFAQCHNPTYDILPMPAPRHRGTMKTTTRVAKSTTTKRNAP